jgi:transcriptional regulator
VIFAGAQHYISPNWYAAKAEHGRVVPTWNYVVVHAYAPVRFADDAGWLMAHLETLTTIHEGQMAKPWKVADAPAEYVAGQARGIVGVELPISRIEGKWKVSQNRSAADRAGVAEGLEQIATAEALAMRALVEGK